MGRYLSVPQWLRWTLSYPMLAWDTHLPNGCVGHSATQFTRRIVEQKSIGLAEHPSTAGRLPTPDALLVDFQQRGGLRGADPYSDLCQYRWPPFLPQQSWRTHSSSLLWISVSGIVPFRWSQPASYTIYRRRSKNRPFSFRCIYRPKLQLPSDRVGCQAVPIYGSPRQHKASELHTLRISADRSYIFQRCKDRPDAATLFASCSRQFGHYAQLPTL